MAQPGGLALLSGPAAKPLLIGVLLFAFQQFAGINALVYFSSSVFREVRRHAWGRRRGPPCTPSNVHTSWRRRCTVLVLVPGKAGLHSGSDRVVVQHALPPMTTAHLFLVLFAPPLLHPLPAAPLQAGVASGTLASAAVGATNVLGTLLAAGLMDRAGRKTLLVNSFLGQVGARSLWALPCAGLTNSRVLRITASPRTLHLTSASSPPSPAPHRDLL